MIEVKEEFDINYIDASRLSKFSRCPANFLFGRLMGLSKPGNILIAPNFGTAIHRALPYCYKGSDIEEAMAEFDLCWDGFNYPDGGDDKRNHHRARAMLENFARGHSKQTSPYKILTVDFDAPTDELISPNEVPFLIDIGGPLAAAGRIDLPVEWNSTGDLWVLDYKTASEISARYFNNFTFHPQTVLYTIAGSHIFGRRCNGMIIEALRVSKTNAETQLNFNFVKDHEIDSFIRFANAQAETILACNRAKTWPKKCTSCGPYAMFGFPSRICEFMPICQCEDWEDGVSQFNKGKPWHPFEVKTGE